MFKILQNIFFLFGLGHLVMTFKKIVSLGLAYFSKCHLLVKKSEVFHFEKVKKL